MSNYIENLILKDLFEDSGIYPYIPINKSKQFYKDINGLLDLTKKIGKVENPEDKELLEKQIDSGLEELEQLSKLLMEDDQNKLLEMLQNLEQMGLVEKLKNE